MTEVIFKSFVFFCIPYCNFSFLPACSQHPRDIFIELNWKQFSLLHVFLWETFWHQNALFNVCNVPNFAHFICAYSCQHRWNMRTKCNIRARFFMSFNCKHWIVELSCVKPIYNPAFRRYDEIMLNFWVPLGIFNVFTDTWLQLITQGFILVANINNIEFSVVASSEQNLLVNSVPLDSLNFITVQLAVRSFASKFVNVPDPNCFVCTAWCQVFRLKWV